MDKEKYKEKTKKNLNYEKYDLISNYIQQINICYNKLKNNKIIIPNSVDNISVYNLAYSIGENLKINFMIPHSVRYWCGPSHKYIYNKIIKNSNTKQSYLMKNIKNVNNCKYDNNIIFIHTYNMILTSLSLLQKIFLLENVNNLSIYTHRAKNDIKSCNLYIIGVRNLTINYSSFIIHNVTVNCECKIFTRIIKNIMILYPYSNAYGYGNESENKILFMISKFHICNLTLHAIKNTKIIHDKFYLVKNMTLSFIRNYSKPDIFLINLIYQNSLLLDIHERIMFNKKLKTVKLLKLLKNYRIL